MDYDKDKVDDMILALLWLTTFGEKRSGQIALRAWKLSGGRSWAISLETENGVGANRDKNDHDEKHCFGA
jgi:hypothetical protein